MDHILSNTIIITKCLLSYKIPHQIIEKIILEAFNPEIIRYPSLYSTHVCHPNCHGGNFNCHECHMILNELLECYSCKNNYCKFCADELTEECWTCIGETKYYPGSI
jgi:hypothetical protein